MKLEEVKSGDKVVYYHGYYDKRIKIVERVTKTQIITVDGKKYRLLDGYEVGYNDRFMRPHISVKDSDEIIKIEKEIFCSDVMKKIKELKDIPYEMAVALHIVMEKYK